MNMSEKLELEIRREDLLLSTAKLNEIIEACKVASRAAAKHRRLAQLECNGVVKWNHADQRIDHYLTEDDLARIDRQMKECRDMALKALKSILVPGLEYDFRNDHVYCMVRIRDKKNRRAFSL